MNLKMKIYYLLINRVPGIRTKYNNYRKYNRGIKRIKAWGYLGVLNFRYYILGQHNIGEEFLYPDKNKKVIIGSESELTAGMKPEELCEKLEKYDVISFDVFDTLLLRKMRFPADVFYIMQKELHYINLKSLRMDAEWQARQKRFKEFGDYEVTLEEIWKEVESKTTINAETGMQAEFESEKSVCYANPYFLEIVTRLKGMGKRIILCSDMYLDDEMIQEILKGVGYPQFEDCFISSKYRKSKANGELFDIVKQKIGPELKYIHIGDNEYSDVILPRKHGMESIYYQNVQDVGEKQRAEDMSSIISSIYAGLVNGYLHNGLTSKSFLYEFGYIYGGLFVVGYCQYIHDFVKTKDIDKVLFLSRDGDVLQKAYNIMYPDEIRNTEYVYWSRLAATKMCAHRFKAFFIERMLYHKVNQNYTLKSVFETMELYPCLKEFLLSCADSASEESILDSHLLDELLKYIDENWNQITESYKDQLDEGKRYYSNLIKGANRIAVVDVGWVGSGAITLKQLIEYEWKLDCKVYGLVAGSCSGTGMDFDSTAIEYADGEITSYLFSASSNRDIWKIHDAAKGHNMIVELLLSSANKSFRGFTKGTDGNYQFSSKQETIDADEIQAGILEFVMQYMEHPLHELKISGRDAMAPILLLYQNEDYINSLLVKSGIKANIE